MRRLLLPALAAGLALGLAAAAQTPAPDPQTVLAAARAALGPASPPLANLELQGAFRMQPPGSQRQQQGQLEVRFVFPANFQRRFSLHLPFGDFVTTETLAGGEVSVQRQLPPGVAQRFAAFRHRSGGSHLTAAQREAFRRRRQAEQLRSVSAQSARDQLAFLLLPPPGATLRYAGLAQARSGQQADMIQVTAPAFTAPVTLFLDRHSHRLLMLSYSGYAPVGMARAAGAGRFRSPGAGSSDESSGAAGRRAYHRPAPQTIFIHFTQWRRVAGRWFPMEVTESAAGATFSEWDLKRVRVNISGLDAQSLAKQ